MEEDEGETGAVRAAVRNAKKAQRPTKIGMPESRPAIGKKAKVKAKNRDREREKRTVKVAGAKGVFDRDLGEKRRSAGGGTGAREGARANKGDKIGGMGKKGPKGKGRGKR